MTCALIHLDTYRRLRHLQPEHFARRVRLRARAAGCTVSEAQYVGEQARVAALAGTQSRWDILQTTAALATALAEGRAQLPPEAEALPCT